MVDVASADVKPAVIAGLAVDYPVALQEKFGPRNVLTQIAVAANGVPMLVKVQVEEGEAELAPLIEQAVYKMRFSPAQVGESPVSVSMKIRVPLKPDFDPASVFSTNEVGGKPSAIRMSTPLYPYEMQFTKSKGKVIVEFVILPEGSVRSLRVVESSHGAFNKPALDCVARSEWAPATKDGKPVACLVRIPIHFAP